ncbi:MAG: RluA family pseudouridine synthase [Phycisphaerae bacterium]
MSKKQPPIDIVYECDDFVAVNKPAGISLTKERDGSASMIELLSRRIEAGTELKAALRLDKLTPGIIVVSKTDLFHRAYAESITQNTSSVVYLALVSGFIPTESGRIKMPIGKGKEQGRMQIDPRKGNQSLTYWQRLADFGHFSLLAVRPMTDRTHQLRIHLAHKGMPLAIDPIYASERPIYLSEFKRKYRRAKFGDQERPLVENMTLCAYQVSFAEGISPVRHIAAAPEKKFTAAIKMLAKHCGKDAKSFNEPEHFAKILASGPLTDLEILQYEGREDGYTRSDD